jgi:uncharacterized membrane protein YeiH
MTPVLAGCLLYALGRALGGPSPALALAAIAVIAAFRGCAIRRGWSFPDWLTYKPLG